MDNYKKFKKEKRHQNIALIIVTIFFLIVGIACTIIGNYFVIVDWLKKCGIAFLILSVPLIITVIRTVIVKKIKEM